MWTSGTTGEPKPILHQHSAYFELIDRVLGPLRAKPADPARPPSPNLIAVSLALNAGIYNTLFGLRAGAAIVIMEGFAPGRFAELVREFGIRSTVLPPAALSMLAADESVTDLAPLRYVRSITAPLAPLQARRFGDKFGVTVLNGYGQAEIGEVIGWTAADAKEHPEKIGAVGRPHPGVAIKVVTESGAVVTDPEEVGRLLVKPPRMAAGYATGGELADRIDAEGFLDTGDLARVDPDGFVWIEGRGGEVINRGGNKVFPDHVADALRLVPGVVDAGVVGVPDQRLGAVPVAFVVTDRDVTDDDLRAGCREHLAPYKVPVAFHRVDALPRTEVGKLRRAELAELHQSLTGAAP
jgi:acyl-coenzyme A synthetase/AMP-(fatty) acid ligase